MRIVMKNALGVVVQVQEIFHGANPVIALSNFIKREVKQLQDGDTFKFENDEDDVGVYHPLSKDFPY